MKTSKYLILFLLLSLPVSQLKADGYYWQDINARFDSLMRSMEFWSKTHSDSINPQQIIVEMRQLAQENKNNQMFSRANYWEACSRKDLTNDSMLSLIDNAYKLCNQSTYPYDYARIAMQKAVLLSHKANYSEAFRHYTQAIDELQKTGDNRLLAYSYYNIGYIFLLLGEYDDAIPYVSQADSIFKKEHYQNELLQCKLLQANIYIRSGEKEKAQKILRPIIEKLNQNDPIEIRISLLTSYLSCLSNQDSIHRYTEQTYQLAQQTNDPYFRLATMLNKGHNLLNIGQTDSAYHYAIQAMNDWKNGAAMPGMEEGIYKLLTYVYAKQQRWDSAYHYQSLYYICQDSLRGKNVLADINRLKIKRQMEERKMQDILSKQKSKQTFLFFLSIGLTLLVLLILSGYIIWILRRRMQAQQERQRQKDREHIEQLSKEKELVESKNRELSSNAVLLMKKNSMLKEMLKDMEEMSKQQVNNTRELQQRIQIELKEDSSWESFKIHFDKVHPMFFSILKEQFPKLTENELRLCAYIRIGLNNKQIAQMLLVQSKAILQARYRLKKKMELPDDITLNSYLENIHI